MGFIGLPSCIGLLHLIGNQPGKNNGGHSFKEAKFLGSEIQSVTTLLLLKNLENILHSQPHSFGYPEHFWVRKVLKEFLYRHDFFYFLHSYREIMKDIPVPLAKKAFGWEWRETCGWTLVGESFPSMEKSHSLVEKDFSTLLGPGPLKSNISIKNLSV